MSILGIGTWELLLIVLLIVVVLGPERAREAGMGAGRFIKRLTTSQFWRELIQAAHFMQRLPQNLVRMAELEEITSRLDQERASMQQALNSIAKPLENVTPKSLLQEPLRSIQAVEQDVRQAVTGRPPEPAPASQAPAPVPSGPPPGTESIPVTEPAPPGLAPAPGPKPDAAAPAPAEPALADYAPEWPQLLQRLEEIERRQAELAEQLRLLQAPSAGEPVSEDPQP